MKIKLWISLVLAFLVFIFITQNTETVHVTFLAWSVEISLVLVLFIMLGLGIIIGWLLNSYMRYVNKKGKDPATHPARSADPKVETSGDAGQIKETGDKQHES